MHKSMPQPSVTGWELTNRGRMGSRTKGELLTEILRAAESISKGWSGAGIQRAHQLLYFDAEPLVERFLRKISRQGRKPKGLLTVWYVSEVEIVRHRIYLMLTDEGRVFFSDEAPVDGMFQRSWPIEDFDAVIEGGLQYAFIEDVRNVMVATATVARNASIR